VSPLSPLAPVAPPTPVTATPGASAAPQSAAPANLQPPAVNYFSTTSDKLPPNTIIILVWSVSGADAISIDNGIGNVDAEGRLALIPAASTTYILTAINAAGRMTAQVEVEVSDLLASSAHYRPGYKITPTGLTCVVGSPLTISLDTLTSDDSEWVIDYYDKTMFSYVGSNYVSQNPLTRGVDGQQQFTFKPLDAGDTRILVSYVNHRTPTKFDSIIYNIRIRH